MMTSTQTRPSVESTATVSDQQMVYAAVILLGVVLVAVFRARNWPLVHDAPLMHYVVFLMHHGMAPYRDIVEMNMPGSYLIEAFAMRTFGAGAGGWVLWDVFTGLVAVASCVWIAGTRRRAAGLVAGCLIYLFHLSDGSANIGQRDWTLSVLLLLAFGFLFQTIRERKAAWMVGFMLCCGLVASVKPHFAALALGFLVAVCWQQRARIRSAPLLGWSLVGALVPTAAVIAFLLRWGVSGAFLSSLNGIVRFYVSLRETSYLHLAAGIFPLSLWPLFLAGIFLFWKNRSWERWQSCYLLGGAGAGAALYLLQRKGWTYQRYSAVAMLVLWIALELHQALGSDKLSRRVAAATLAFACIAVSARAVHRESTTVYPMQTMEHLEHDLIELGGPALSGHVQCLDMVMGGCIDVLYQMKLVQSTGFIYDFYLFPEHGTPFTTGAQARFLSEVSAQPPRVIVLSSHTWPGEQFSYDQIARWPAFEDLLAHRYTLTKEFFRDPALNTAAGYRLYLLKDSAPL